jgi:hypothetical protein
MLIVFIQKRADDFFSISSESKIYFTILTAMLLLVSVGGLSFVLLAIITPDFRSKNSARSSFKL